jgi:hypothetical protein
MKKYVCPDCGKTFEEGNVPASCPGCGCPSSEFQEHKEPSMDKNISPALESSNDFGAEHTANALAGITLVIGIIIGLIGLIAGFSLLTLQGGGESMLFGILCIVFGLVFFLVFLISWAFIKLLVNISYRLTRLDNKYNPK